MTTTMIKYMLRGALTGLEEYERMLEKEHIDPAGKGHEILFDGPEPLEVEKKPVEKAAPAEKKVEVKMDPSTPIDLDKLLEDA